MNPIDSLAEERIAEITKEFTKGFKFLADYPKSVTFFGSTRTQEGEFYYDKARTLSYRIVRELHYSIVSGGGPGIMEAADRGAYEAGGDSVGLLIKLPHSQPTNSYLKSSISFYYFFARKVFLAYGAEVFIFFPGGYGTLDEFFEILTLVQTRKIEGVPLICYGSEYWNKIKEFFKDELLSKGMIAEEDFGKFIITDDEDRILEIIRSAPVRKTVPLENFAATLQEQAEKPVHRRSREGIELQQAGGLP